MQDTYTGREKETLEVLKIYPLKTLALEEKKDMEEFEEYDPNQIVVKVNKWREGITSLIDEVLLPVNVKVPKDCLMSEFVSQISKQFEIEEDKVLILKRNPMMNLNSVENLS